MPAPLSGPDVRQLSEQELVNAEFPGGRQQKFRVFIDPKTHEEIWKHAQADTNVEICGVLVGNWAKDAQGPFLNVSASIRGEAAAKKFAEVTFTHDTWAAINAEMDSKYTDRSIVGWYHTHPDFGIFLSDRDKFIQENFFSAPGQVALVVDPIRKTEGVFVWEAGQIELTPHYWVGNQLVLSTDGNEDRRPRAAGMSPAPEVSAVAYPNAAVPQWDLMSILQKSLQYVLVFLVGWLLAGRLNQWMIDGARQDGTAEAIYRFGLRPELELRLSELQTDLVGLSEDLQQIAGDHSQRIADKEIPKEEREKQMAAWQDVQMRLNRASALLQRINREYCLDDQQRFALRQFLSDQVVKMRRAEEEQKKATASGSKSPGNEKSKPEAKKPDDAEKKAADKSTESETSKEKETVKTPAKS